MKPIQYYIGILSVLGYVYCLPVVGQVEDKVVRKGNPRLEYTDVKTGRSPEGKMFTVSFNIVESINRLRTQEIVYTILLWFLLTAISGLLSRLCVFPERKDTRLLPVRKDWVVTRVHYFL